jgi:hypothetical protein
MRHVWDGKTLAGDDVGRWFEAYELGVPEIVGVRFRVEASAGAFATFPEAHRAGFGVYRVYVFSPTTTLLRTTR